MTDQTTKFAAGQVIAGKYLIERQIGAGGMGIVAVATHLTLGQRVAIKFLNEEAMESADIIMRFEREAKACVQLRSEHVARVTDVGTLENGAPYIVMEYLEGEDLSSLLNSGETLPISVAVDYVLQACEAIAEAHRLGIVHRDLKPANLFLTRGVDGGALIKVLDFGISKVQADSFQDTKLTSTTAIIGSPSYMSPEQLRASRDVDHRGDIWALGVILFELLTNTLPFQSTNVMELCMKVASEQVPRIETRRADLPRGMGDIVARCLEKDPNRRFQSVADLVSELARYQGQEISTTERIRRVGGGSGPYASPSTASLSGGYGAVGAGANGGPGPSGAYPYPANSSHPAQGLHQGSQGNQGGANPGSQSSSGHSSARVLVHGGTSVSWGKTEMHAGLPPAKRSGTAMWIAISAVAVLLLGGGGVGTYLVSKHRAALASQPLPGDVPLPHDRTNLPPLSGTTVSPVTAGSGNAGNSAQVAVNPMPQDRASLTQPAQTNVPAGTLPPTTGTAGAGGNAAGNAAGNNTGIASGRKPTGQGNGQRPITSNGNAGGNKPPANGSDELLPDARK